MLDGQVGVGHGSTVVAGRDRPPTGVNSPITSGGEFGPPADLPKLVRQDLQLCLRFFLAEMCLGRRGWETGSAALGVRSPDLVLRRSASSRSDPAPVDLQGGVA